MKDNDKLIKFYNQKEKTRCQYPTGILKVNLKALESNIKTLRLFAEKNAGKKLKFLLPIKGNGYGCGMLPIAEFAEKNKLCDYLGVAHFEEAFELREADIKMPILILAESFLEPHQIEYIVKNDIEKVISSVELLRVLEAKAKKQKKIAKIHLKIDTGMGRLGIFPEDVSAFINEIKNYRHVKLVGVMTHFSVADSKAKGDIAYTKNQITKFANLKKRISDLMPNQKIIFHTANSGSVLSYPSSLFDMIRPGIAAYGAYSGHSPIDLAPVMQLQTKITLIKKYPKGSSIGYGRTYASKSDEYIATVPIGYADGLSRALSNKLTPIVNGKKAQSVGRISMDQFSLKVEKETKEGGNVTIIGKDGEYSNSAQDIAKQVNAISYEILCALGNAKRLRHEYFYASK